MKPQKWLGAALATTVAGALVLGVQGPSYTAGDKQRSDRTDNVEQEGQKREAIDAADRYLRTHGRAVRRGADDSIRRVAATPGDVMHAPTHGFCVRLLETEGRAGRATLRAFRPLAAARQVDFQGQPLLELPIEDDKITIDVAAHEWIQIEARWK